MDEPEGMEEEQQAAIANVYHTYSIYEPHYQHMHPLIYFDDPNQQHLHHSHLLSAGAHPTSHHWEHEHGQEEERPETVTVVSEERQLEDIKPPMKEQANQIQSKNQSQDESQTEIQRDNRELHNEIERRRRSRIKHCCEVLRTLVPGLSEKTDKASVLEHTVKFVTHLSNCPGFTCKCDI